MNQLLDYTIRYLHSKVKKQTLQCFIQIYHGTWPSFVLKLGTQNSKHAYSKAIASQEQSSILKKENN